MSGTNPNHPGQDPEDPGLGATIVDLPDLEDSSSNQTSGGGLDSQSGQGSGTGQGSSTGQGPGTLITGSNTNPGGTKAVYKPDKPKFGDVTLVGSDQWNAWTGGKPRADWSGLEDPTPARIEPQRYRPTSITAQQKCEVFRTKGLQPKFAKDGNLVQFQKHFMKHLVKNGLDTVSYVQNPRDPSKVVSVVDHHSLFSREQGIAAGEAAELHFDAYDHSNSENAATFLLNSVDASLVTQIEEGCAPTDNFVTHWMHLMHAIRSVSLDRFNAIKVRFAKRDVRQFEGEDIEAAATQYLQDYQELHSAAEFDFNLLSKLLETLCLAAGGSEDFKYPLRAIISKLDQTLLDTRHMTYEERTREFVAQGVDIRSILDIAKSQYRKMKDRGLWPATRSNQDTRGLSQNYGRAMKAELDHIKQLMANALVQYGGGSGGNSRDKSSDRCLNCNEVGHWARDCPHPKKPKGRKPFNSRDKSQRNNPGKKKGSGGKRGNGSRSSKPPPPKEGESEIIFIEGIKYYWCATCKRWTRSHGTDTHRGKEEPQAAAIGLQRVQWDMAPAAFHARVRPAPSPWLGQFMKMVLPVCGILLAGVLAMHTDPFFRMLSLVPLFTVCAMHVWKSKHVCDSTQVSPCVKAPQERIRTGPNIQKQRARLQKKVGEATKWRSKGKGKSRGRKSMKPPPLHLRHACAAHPRFSHIGRPFRRYPPSPKYRPASLTALEIELQNLKAELMDVEKQISYWERARMWKGKGRSNYNRPGTLDCCSLEPEQLYRKVRKGLRMTIELCLQSRDRARNVTREVYRIQALAEEKAKREAAKAAAKNANMPKPKPLSPRMIKWYTDVNCKGFGPTLRRKRSIDRIKRRYKARYQVEWDEMIKDARNNPAPVHDLPPLEPKARRHLRVTPPEERTLAQCFVARAINVAAISSSGQTAADSEAILFDSGANCCVTNRMEDFVGPFTEADGSQIIDGIGKGLKICGKGHVAWTFEDDKGILRTLKLPCYYIPSSQSRIASVQVILQTYPKESITITAAALKLNGSEGVNGITIPMSPSSNLPLGIPVSGNLSVANLTEEAKEEEDPEEQTAPEEETALVPSAGHPALTSPRNTNLTSAEKELLHWHHRLGHVGMRRVMWLMRQGALATSAVTRSLHERACKFRHVPLCTACQFAKQRRRSAPGTVKRNKPDDEALLKTDALLAGARIFCDHFECRPKGRRLHTYGKEPDEKKFKGGCIFVDAASGLIHVELQVYFNSSQTLKAKMSFEEFCKDLGVIPQSYVSDEGGAFTSKEYTKHLQKFKQKSGYATPGAHHSNGVAERSIGTLMSISRAMMHHAALHWPQVADIALWPLAVLHAAHILNRIPSEETGRSPYELFTQQMWSKSKLLDLHVFGCPVYVLDSALSGGRKIPRWSPRSSRCMYVGQSLKQGHAIPLVLNLDTGAITAQYHVVFDDHFQTVEANQVEGIDFDQPDWYETFGLTEWQYVAEDTSLTTPLLEHSPVESEGVARREELRVIRDQQLATEDPATLQRENDPTSQPTSLQRESDPTPQPLPTPHPTPAPSPAPAPASQPSVPSAPSPSVVEATPSPPAEMPVLQRENVPQPQPSPTPTVVESVPPRNTTPVRRPKPKPKPTRPPTQLPRTRSQAKTQAKSEAKSQAPPPPLRRSTRTTPSVYRHPSVSQAFLISLEVINPDSLPEPYAGKAAHSDPDTYTWDEAMASPYKEQFLQAAHEEIQALVDKGTWVEDLKSNATTKIIPSSWVFRIKKNSEGVIKRFKGRTVLRGDLQEDNGESNYSPVAAWPTVRVFLIVSAIKKWVTTTIDFSNAFVQSYLPEDEPVWMHIPRGYRSTLGPDYCLRLVKSLYGHRRAPQLWFEFAAKAFKKLGLVQSAHDECLWYGPDIMVVQYVDDCGISAPSHERIDKFIEDLKEQGFELTKEESFEEFLGIKFESHSNGSVECTQKGLIKKTLEAAGMVDCNPNSTPAVHEALGADKEGEPMCESWNYRAICGMLLYLSTNTRPDIAFAVSQVCRFSNEPKKSHATAVKTILRYLKKTADKGLIIHPGKGLFHLDLYVDADFCGLFGREDPYDKNSVRSRTGYIVLLGGWPIIWKSAIEGSLSQSTTEAEYCALSSALRVFLPLKWLITEMISKIQCEPVDQVKLHTTVFEDNQSAYLLATNQRITNRTKYLLAKWHWFWDLYNKGEFQIVKCPTDKMAADYLTKALKRDHYEQNRRAVQGW